MQFSVELIGAFIVGIATGIVLVYWSLARDKMVVKLKEHEMIVSKGTMQRMNLMAAYLMRTQREAFGQEDDEEFEELTGR